jgi:hypothetical protein
MFDLSNTSGLGARRGRKRRSKAAGSCGKRIIHFRTKRGKVVQFRGKSGPGCGPRPKPSTRHLAPYKRAMSKAARACKGSKNFRRCVANRMKHA